MKIILLLLLSVFSLAAPGWGANSSREFGGVGIDGVPWADGSIVVKQVVLGGPAQLAGIRAGDIITQIDGKATLGSDFRKMVEYRLRGRSGTSVELRIRRPGSVRPLSFNLVRRQLAVAGARKEEPKKGE